MSPEPAAFDVSVQGVLAEAGGVAALSAAHEAVSAHLGNNYLPLVERFYRSSRSGLFDLLNVLVLEPTSTDRGVLDAVRFLRGQRAKTGEFIAGRVDGWGSRPPSSTSPNPGRSRPPSSRVAR